eukprot:gene314-572_t
MNNACSDSSSGRVRGRGKGDGDGDQCLPPALKPRGGNPLQENFDLTLTNNKSHTVQKWSMRRPTPPSLPSNSNRDRDRNLLGRGTFGYVLYGEIMRREEVVSVSPSTSSRHRHRHRPSTADNTVTQVALKICAQKSPLIWEVIIQNRILVRLATKSSSSSTTTSSSYTYSINDFIMHTVPDAALAIFPLMRLGTLHGLLEALKRPPLCHSMTPSDSELLCCHLTIQMLRAVSILHRVGVLHCDIKPDNWMLDYDFDTTQDSAMRPTLTLRLIDLGKAKDLRTQIDEEGHVLSHRNTQFVAFSGSSAAVGYGCPQMRSETPWSYQADYFALCCCTHELLFGSSLILKENETVSCASRRGWLLSPSSSLTIPPPKDTMKAPSTSVKRYWRMAWGPVLATLLNHNDTHVETEVERLCILPLTTGLQSCQGVDSLETISKRIAPMLKKN